MSINETALPVIVSDDVQLIGVRFMDVDGDMKGKEYAYKCSFDVAKDDIVVVCVYDYGYNVAKVTNLDLTVDDNIAYRWAVARVDMTEYKKNQDTEDALIMEVRRRKTTHQKRALMAELGLLPDDTNLLTFGSGPAQDSSSQPS